MPNNLIEIEAISKLHWGSDNPARSNVKENRRDSFPVKPIEIKTTLSKLDRDKVIVFILNAIYSASKDDLKKSDYFYSTIIYSARENTLARFIEMAMRRSGAMFLYDNFIDAFDLISDDEFLQSVRDTPQYYIMKLRKLRKDKGKISLSSIKPIEEKTWRTKSSMEIPIGSANSFRHTLRTALADDFLERIGKKELSDKALVLFYNGGVVSKGSASDFINESTNREFQDMCPMFGLMGAMDDLFKMTSVLCTDSLIPRCQELGFETAPSAHELMTDVFGTTGDARNDDRLFDNKRAEKQSMLPYYQESFKRGTVFDMFFGLRPIVRDMDMMHSVAKHGLDLVDEIGMLGAKNSVAHGRVKLNYENIEFKADENLYLEYIESKKEEMLNFWNAQWK